MDAAKLKTLDLEFAQKVKQWEGVPFVNQQSSPYGCDCVGLILGTALEIGYDFRAFDIPSRPVNAQSNALTDCLSQCCTLVNDMAIGRILTFEIGDYVQHCAVLVDIDRIVHGDRAAGKITMIDYPENLRRRLINIYRVDWSKAS